MLNNDIAELKDTLAAMQAYAGKLAMQRAVFKWALIHKAELDGLGLTQSLIETCERVMEEKCR